MRRIERLRLKALVVDGHPAMRLGLKRLLGVMGDMWVAKGVLRTADVQATFSRPMNAGTIDGATFYLRKQGTTGPQVRAKVSYNAATRTALLNPTNNLETGAYTATVLPETGGALPMVPILGGVVGGVGLLARRVIR